MKALPLILFGLFLTGCYRWQGANGTRHTFIFGFGCISSTNQAGVVVDDVRGVGLFLDNNVQLGFFQKHQVELDPSQASNVAVTIKAAPFSLLLTNFDLRHGNPSLADTNPTINQTNK